jgi:hypothetical protein
MSSYFNFLPDIDYINRQSEELDTYIRAKNFFRRVKIRESVSQNLFAFEKYNIIGDERPDQVADTLYDDPTLDWVILIVNNIIDIRSEWPLPQRSFDRYLLDKYGSYDKIYETHHYETIEVKNGDDQVILEAGLIVPQNYTVNYYDYITESNIQIANATVPVTNFDIEQKYQNDKRTINILKVEYLQTLLEDTDKLMPYLEGSQGYINENLRRVSDIRQTN